jgi:hypothetical protein
MILGEVADVRMGYAFRSRLEHNPAGDVVVIQMKDIDDRTFLHTDGAYRAALSGIRSRHFLRRGDLVFRSRGLTNGAALVKEDIGPAVLAAPMLLIRPRRALPEYLHWFLNAAATKASLTALAAGSSVRMISADALRSLPVPLPPVATQKTIADTAAGAELEQRLMQQIATLREKITAHILMTRAEEESQ